ncbi:hypothetical protein CEXT_808621 [Caerostris extrusa]|uniref:Uncharacterized protein n=1 Tax=Caerostris extrusa TaxID=172846 RepID=A0AAV4SPE0_CAEEX|nr:hypothetical protein CEXT_808621 [Caerostris extrusa]
MKQQQQQISSPKEKIGPRIQRMPLREPAVRDKSNLDQASSEKSNHLKSHFIVLLGGYLFIRGRISHSSEILMRGNHAGRLSTPRVRHEKTYRREPMTPEFDC